MTCDIAPNRIYGQYRGDVRPKLKRWYDITRVLGCELSSVAEEIRYSYDIDNATSFELNVLGRIVGISRSFESSVNLNPSAFGKTTSQFGGQITQFGASTLVNSQELSNEIYRILIRAKIAKNTSEATLDGIISALNYIVPSPNTIIIDNEDMTFSVSFDTTLTEVQRFVLNTFDIIPRPQGVEFLGYVEEPGITEFGGSFGWGDPRAQFSFTFGV
mgnify:CR=1 FL=1